MLVLSLFPGIGLLDMAFEDEGFCIVRGPDVLWGGDIRRFHPPAGRFDGVIGGPPGQVFSRLRHVNPLAGQRHGNLIPEFERVVAAAAPAWFVMENVPEAPAPVVEGYIVARSMVRDVWVGGETNRLRSFCFGTAAGARLDVEWVALHTTEPELSAYASGGGRPVPVALGGSGKPKRSLMKNLGYQSAAAAAAASKACRPASSTRRPSPRPARSRPSATASRSQWAAPSRAPSRRPWRLPDARRPALRLRGPAHDHGHRPGLRPARDAGALVKTVVAYLLVVPVLILAGLVRWSLGRGDKR